jgi:Neuraminidase (sialidase)
MKKIITFIPVLLFCTLSRGQWEPDVRLTFDPSSSETSLNNAWCIAAAHDTLHVVWYDERDGNKELYYKRSTDQGQTWGPDTRLTFSIRESWDPSIALQGDWVYIVFEDWRNSTTNGEIYFRRSPDRGETWEPEVRLTVDSAGSMLPSMAVCGPVIHIVWQDERISIEGDIFYKRSLDGGNTWSSDTCLSNDPAYSGIPSIAVWNQNVHVVWEDNRNNPANGSIYYKRSTDGGNTWGPDIWLTTLFNDTWDPAVAVNDSVVHVVFYDETTKDIYYRRSDDNGTSWGPIQRLTNAAGYSRYPSITVSGLNVHITWEDTRDGNFEIYYKRSTDGGNTWEPDVRLTNANYNSIGSSVTFFDSAVYVVWYDKRDLNEEIYFKRNLTGNPLLPTGIPQQENDLSAYIFPNPANQMIRIISKDAMPAILQISIRNILGQEVMQKSINDEMSTIDVSFLENGLYFLFISDTTGKKGSVKFVVSR